MLGNVRVFYVPCCASWPGGLVGVSSCIPKGFQFNPQLGRMQEAADQCFFHIDVSFSTPSSLSQKNNKTYPWVGRKEGEREGKHVIRLIWVF